MALEELDVSLFTEESVISMLANTPTELADAVKKGLAEALAAPEVKAAFLAMFTEEEQKSLADADPDELAAALSHELARDESFHNAMLESAGQWVADVQPPIPQTAEELDSVIAQWQIPTGESPQEHPAAPEGPPATGATPA